MPIEINELQITTVVQDTVPASPGSSAVSPADREAIIRECVEQILEILTQKNDR